MADGSRTPRARSRELETLPTAAAGAERRPPVRLGHCARVGAARRAGPGGGVTGAVSEGGCRSGAGSLGACVWLGGRLLLGLVLLRRLLWLESRPAASGCSLLPDAAAGQRRSGRRPCRSSRRATEVAGVSATAAIDEGDRRRGGHGAERDPPPRCTPVGVRRRRARRRPARAVPRCAALGGRRLRGAPSRRGRGGSSAGSRRPRARPRGSRRWSTRARSARSGGASPR